MQYRAENKRNHLFDVANGRDLHKTRRIDPIGLGHSRQALHSVS